MATIKQVAERAGVGISTVSRVLRAQGYVSADVRARVQAAIDTLGYVPNSAAQALRGRRTWLIGMLLGGLEPISAGGIISGAEQIAFDRGYGLVVASSRGNPDRERQQIERLLARKVDGLLIASQDRKHERIGVLKTAGVPCVMMGVGAGDFPADRVYVDTQTAAHKLTAHLLEHGHERIAAIHGPLSTGGARQRKAGFDRAFADRGLTPDPALVRYADYTHQGGYEACLDLLQQSAPPTGLFASNGYMALGVLQACRELGVRIPRDLAVVTVDDVEVESDLHQFLTAAAQPTQTFGRLATQLLIDRIDKRPVAGFRDLALQSEIIIRQSCGCAEGTPLAPLAATATRGA